MTTTPRWAFGRWAAVATGWTLALGSLGPAWPISARGDEITTNLDNQTVAETLASDTGFTYETFGEFGFHGIVGPNLVNFNNTAATTLTPPSGMLNLGEFRIGTARLGGEATYMDAPFNVTITGDDPNQIPVRVSGVLNGRITRTGTNLVATFRSIDPTEMRVGDLTVPLSLERTSVPLEIGSNPLKDVVRLGLPQEIAPVPEPTTLAILMAAVVGYGLRRRLVLRRS
ncbi:protein of unknown function DUF1555 [Isosphaera pallida ATCC 43644]|uniref:Ice-binding protein C-terminal domain-containing protein n=1 Tax=Isosphaera pallida (strain ATCC 43644 / DSM 9630 / IS1B) TaxID=575540 RepID=E8R0T8_ISOPI|nr:PEP-CTERM sorting domain-containing protein [Isosphaera pallida]ADV62284.1 protein of unknown function DUF1555 [Isosphaera pallida ATCC 43644]